MPSRMYSLTKCLLALSALSFSGGTAAAGSDAWAALRKEVEASCLAAAAPLVKAPQIVVDPFGSQSYGLAFLNGVATEGGLTRSFVCVYDKTAKRAEIGGSMALETAVPSLQPDLAQASGIDAPATASAASAAAPSPAAVGPGEAPAVNAETAPDEGSAASGPVPQGPAKDAAAALADRFLSPSTDAVPTEMAALAPAAPALPGAASSGSTPGFAGQCDATCALTLSGLGDPDRKALEELAAEVKRTVEKTAAAKLASDAAEAREAALAAAASADGEKGGTVAPPTAALAGETSCVLYYYYGYAGETSRTVGRHRCAVKTNAEGGLVVEKTSGERLRAEIKPLTGEVAAFVGRTFQPGGKETRYDRQKPVDPANDDLGNMVGFAAAKDDGGIVLVSSQLRRFEKKGDFFWVLALDAR